jgi:hypothetical protein
MTGSEQKDAKAEVEDATGNAHTYPQLGVAVFP